MTREQVQQARAPRPKDRFPDFPPRDDMQNSLHLDDQSLQAALRRHFGSSDTLIVLSEVPIRWTPGQREGHRIPDLLVAFDVDRALAIEQNGYSIRDQGKPRDLVLEIASESTGEADCTDKRRDYAAFGIPEYWRFDPSGGRHHDAPLEIRQAGQGRLWGHSDILNLDFCWEDGRLRWWDPVAERYLETHDEEADARIADQEAASRLRAGLNVPRPGSENWRRNWNTGNSPDCHGAARSQPGTHRLAPEEEKDAPRHYPEGGTDNPNENQRNHCPIGDQHVDGLGLGLPRPTGNPNLFI